jgi:putative molybdopterin biosynthesis protein
MADPFRQTQFLTVLDRDEADRRFREHLDPRPLETEMVPLAAAHQRVLAEDIRAPIDVPGFDRSNVDGFAVCAEDAFGASEDRPITLSVNDETLAAGAMPRQPVTPGTATAVATGGVIPRGASAVVMIEHTEICDGRLSLNRPAAPGANITWAGTDIGRGETVLPRGTVLTSRETGVLAALGLAVVPVVRRPRVAILSTGDELQPPGKPPRPGCVFDSNQTVLADAVRELGGEPMALGIVPDDIDQLRAAFGRALQTCDAILLSGGTSKGAGDLSYRVVNEFGRPGIVAHGVALKPGKPLCLAVIAEPPGARRPVPVAVLPGFPTSAVLTFHEVLAHVLRELAGRRTDPTDYITATLPTRINSERGRTEYVLVGLVARGSSLVAFPMGKGSGSVTAFGRADGFKTLPRQRADLEAGETVEVRLLGSGVRPADLVVIGSHCIGLDYLLGRLRERGFTSKFLAVGSTGGLDAAKRGECDLAGVHLLDPTTDEYNRPFLTPRLELLPGYGRRQGVLFRREDGRFAGRELTAALADPTCVLANRNRGSGTRILIDRLLGGAKPAGYLSEAKSHSAVAAAVAQGRADWGVAIEPAAREYDLGFAPIRDEQFDFLVPIDRLDRPAVRAFRELLAERETRQALRGFGFTLTPAPDTAPPDAA